MLTQASLMNISTAQLQELRDLVHAELHTRWPEAPKRTSPGQRMKIHDFRVGQRVKFTGRGGVPMVITIERINGKSLSGKTDNPGCRGWRVSPGLCTAV